MNTPAKFPAEGALVMRRRSSWEAADSGVLLWRDNFGYFILFFALPIWTAAFAFRLLPEVLRPWSYLFLWWLKPFFDRFVLHIISVRFFEPRSGLLRLFRGLGGLLLRGLPGDLLWRRFSPWRGARLPLRLLERLRGKPLGQRKRLLERGGLDFCLLISILGLALEAVLLMGEVFFTQAMLDIFRPDLEFSLPTIFSKFEIFLFAAYCFNLMFAESLYVCMGFGLYINSRVEVEGWDIELLFSNFTDPRRARGPKLPALVCIFLLFMSPLKPWADEGDPWDAVEEAGELEEAPPEVKVLIPGPRQPLFPRDALSPAFSPEFPGQEAPLEELEGILASPDFGSERESWGIRFKNRENREGEDFPAFHASWMERIRQIFAYILRLLLVLMFGLGAAFIIRRFLKSRSGGALFPDAASRRFPSAPPQENPGLLLNHAEELHRRGKVREAWALCLGGAIAAYTRYGGVLFPRDATEYDCLALIRGVEKLPAPEAGGRIGGFEALIRRWVRLAYGGLSPAEGDFEDSLHFGRSLLPPPAGKDGARG